MGGEEENVTKLVLKIYIENPTTSNCIIAKIVGYLHSNCAKGY